MLAVAHGTVHGVYTQKPHLSFSRLKEISDLVDFPLVVHGASGLTDEEYRKSVRKWHLQDQLLFGNGSSSCVGCSKKLEQDDSDKQLFAWTLAFGKPKWSKKKFAGDYGSSVR